MIKIGDVFKTKNCGECEVVDYKGHSQVSIKWVDFPCVQSGVYAAALKKGTVKNPMQPSVCGVGFVGLGKYSVSIDGVLTKEYTTWNSMINRCYGEKILNARPTYEDKFVRVDWHNFQNYAEWCQTATGFGEEGWHLDKDGIIKGNKIYSPDTCCFMPAELNMFFLNTSKVRGKYPIGVSFDPSKNKFSSSCCRDGKAIRIGMFDNPEDAFAAYKSYKEQLARELAVKYSGKISYQLMEALNNYEVTIED